MELEALARPARLARLAVVILAAVLAAAPGPAVATPVASQDTAEAVVHNGVDGYLADMPTSQLREVTEALVDLVRKDPWKDNQHPLVFFEPAEEAAAEARRADDDDGHVSQPGPGPNPDEYDDLLAAGLGLAPAAHKRSRYYRRYPWKRVTRTRGSYDPDQYNMCNPSREDVIQLLVGLHRAKEGDLGRTIQFCNRKRPAASVFTNIRFIG
ncbi:ATP synthase subunit alpha, chloroplastic [Frankliniella fusca]|uniref:ATP synthase subunit alpha, chloroplastic n=1 Tax=Frankliniella fusca TaxID=407009 RepID=A0AAE1GR07_9NEOP|nr:ATP synthase subunit alpha, chloroplastic [Frankliniella fusca]